MVLEGDVKIKPVTVEELAAVDSAVIEVHGAEASVGGLRWW